MMEIPEHIKQLLKTLPTKPGCYMMKDTDGTVIYVGKAINLRNRIRSYFHIGAHQDQKTRQLVTRIQDIEWILVGSELEALILEMNLIKRYRPHYNVLLKDDKRYPYIKVHWAEAFPKVTVTRIMAKDGSRYYGPYTSVWAVHQSLDVVRHIFPYLTCDRTITGKDERACLYHDIKLCNAPCIGVINQVEYRQMIDDLGKFLEGRTGPILERLRDDMQRASEEMRFERAAALRDQILAIEKVVERQKVVSPEYVDSDVLAMARSEKEACMQVFFIRGGKLIGREYFLLEGTQDTPDAKVMAEFIKQFYDQASNIPPQVLLPDEVEEANIIRQWLSARRAKENPDMHPVKIIIPHEGQQQELIQMATENAVETLATLKAQWETDRHRQTAALAELESTLKLTSPPNRIECYDISNTQGTYAVGSMVVFEQGVPDKKQYRRFNIRSVEGPDDFASMEEVLMRRFKRWETVNHIQTSEATPDTEDSEQQYSSTKKKASVKIDPSFSHLPDLLIVDGGKGQLSRAVTVLERFNLTDKVPAIGLAKKEEEVFVPGHSNPLLLSRNSQGSYLLQRIRDEAHRFAITAHRKWRTKQGLTSTLESIPGVGPNRRKALLAYFGSLEDIRQASIEQLAAVPGITHKLAKEIKAYLR